MLSVFFERLVQGGRRSAASSNSTCGAERTDRRGNSRLRSLEYFPAKRLDLLDRFSQFALLAAKEAMESSGIQLRDEERPRFGVVTGTGMGAPARSNLAISSFLRSKRHACILLPSPRSCTTRPPHKSAWSSARRVHRSPQPRLALLPGTPSERPST